MADKLILLVDAIEQSVCDHVLVLAEGMELEAVWAMAITKLCDQFPDIESILKIDVIKRTWVREIELRADMIETITTKDGPEFLVANVVKAMTRFHLNASERDIITAMSDPEWFDKQPVEVKVGALMNVRDDFARMVNRSTDAGIKRLVRRALREIL